MQGILIRIVAPHFVAGLVVDDGMVVREAAPILKYMTGWGLARVAAYCRSKGWQIERVTGRY